jgi:FKBP-type peptidyl-prolyl cis-trans isomerase FklB
MRILALTALGALVLGCGQQAGTGSTKLASQEDSVSYILGYKMGENLKQQSVPVKPEIIFDGMKAGFAGVPATMHDSVMQAVMMAFQVRMMGLQHRKDSTAAIDNQKTGTEFLASNKTKDGVKTTPSGLQYKVLKEGSGTRPTAASTVTVHYKGTLLDGKQFDSSYDRGQPLETKLEEGSVIKGWVLGLDGMKVGEVRRLTIPPQLGYGDRGQGSIPPNALLVFEVELVGVKD